MDYKKFIKSRRLRLSILRMFSWLPDEMMLKLQYRIKMGRKLNLHHPMRYTEKVQWYKLNYKDPVMIQCVDKYDVREYIKEKGLENILNECYAVYDSADDIDFDALPNQFVMKNTLGMGGTSVVICKDKKSADLETLRKTANDWIREGAKKTGGLEWPYYSGKKPRIIFERYLDPGIEQGLIDYKFMCFDGKPVYCFYLCDRDLGVSVKEGICDDKLNMLPYSEIGDVRPDNILIPKNYQKMLEIASVLSKDFPHVRVDLYNIKGSVVFGELTFFDASGYGQYDPDEFDFILGSHFLIRAEGNEQLKEISELI